MNTPTASSNSTPEPTVQLQGVDKSFRTGEQVIHVLKKIDFTAFPGELTFIVGPSGCGKTTLLSILCGTLKADSGSIRALNLPLHELPTSKVTQFRAGNVGFIFQQFNLLPTLTAAENVSVPLRINGASPKKSLLKSIEYLERVGLAQKVHELPSRLSGGQQQRVAIARALVHEPLLVVCDEPTSALDSTTGHQIMDLLSSTAKDSRRSVIVVTHDPRTFKYADRMIEMEDGRIQRILPSPDAIASAYPNL